PGRLWRLFSWYQARFTADARQATTQKSHKKRPAPVAETVVQPVARPSQPHKPHFPEVNFPEVKPRSPAPGQPPVFQGKPAMGVSGVGCFMLAVFFVLLIIGFIFLAGS